MLFAAAAFSLFLLCGASSSPYAYQPKILVQDGHLEFVGAEGRNISLRTSVGGFVNLNGDNLVHLVAAAKDASKAVENIKASGLISLQETVSTLQRTVEGSEGLSRRLARLEGRLANITTGGNSNQQVQPSNVGRRVQRLSRRLSRLESSVRDLLAALVNNECSSSPCTNGGSCQDMYNDVLCLCPPNWEGKFCESDVNECTRFAGTDLGCQNGATCVNKPGSYECNCPTGFYGIHCTQKSDNCSTALTQEICGHGLCIPQPAGRWGYTCICEQGWTTEDGRGPECVRDVNECSGNVPACSHDPAVPCINVPGSFHCGACPQGYSGNGFYCTDVDECIVNNGGCSLNPYVPCINTKGSRMCGPCPPGYQGDGTICIYTGVCQINNGGCHPMARCIDNPRISQSYVECHCPSGFTGNGIGPAGCLPSSGGINGGGTVVVGDPCASLPCLNGGSCFAITPSSVSCHCTNGFTGPRCANIINPCLSNPCQNGGTCIHFFNGTGFSCQCSRDYTGDFCQTQQQACGGTLSGLSGTLQFPPAGNSKYMHSTNCAWLLVTNHTKVLNVTFSKFNLEKSSSCQFDWLQIHDGRGAGDHIIGRFCGSDLPKGGNIVSTHNTLYFWFRSDHSIAEDGFEFSWNSTNPVCGGVVQRDSHGTLQSPGSPGKYPPNRDCYWLLIMPLGKRIQIHFFTLQIESHPNCSYDYLEVRDGPHDSSPLLDRYCNSTVPAPLITSGHIAMLYFHSDEHGTDYGFQLSFSAIPGTPGCGGVWTSPTGELSSPNHPDTYRHNVYCEWLIRLPVGDRIKVTFSSFSLEASRSCNFDYIELRDGADEDSPLIARLCGDSVPRPYQSTGNVMFLLFKSDESITSGGFHLTYETMCGGEYTEPSGIIHSPFYPQPYPGSKECIYHISLSPGNSVQLEIQDFDIEESSQCFFDYLQIRDGDYENSTLIGNFCGGRERAPPPIISTFNHLWLKFKTDNSIHQRGFMANYSSIDHTCGGILTSQSGIIESPQHPDQYPPNLDCIWIIKGQPGTVVQLTWQTFTIEDHHSCMHDYIKIFDGRDTHSGALMGTFCGMTSPPVLRTTDNAMTVIFHSDFSVSHDGFSARYSIFDSSSVCGGSYFTTAGVVTSPNHPNPYPSTRDCTWIIQVPNGQQIMLNVTEFQLEDSSQCAFDYLEIRNGGYVTSPLIGKFCGSSIPQQIPSLSNQLYLHFVTDSSYSDRGFKILWDGTTTGCGGRLTSSSGSIISPNYPHNYGRNAECFWKISVSSGSRIQLVIVDLDIEDHSSCDFDYIEIRDGIDSTGKFLGKYCNQNHPLIFTSTSNHIWLKFRTDSSNEGRGFHLRYVSVCNLELKGQRGVLESPNFPEPYPLSIACTWIIVAPMGNSLNISFSHFDLESHTSSNCSFDYLEISEGPNKESPSHKFGRFCGSELPAPIASELDHVFIHFVTDTSISGIGFRLEWVVNGCGGLLEHPFGSISTPGYPNGYPLSTTCEWHIRLRVGESIELTINAYDLEHSVNCRYDYVKVYGGPDETSPLLGEVCEKKTKPSVYTSSGNNMLVKFQSDSSFSGKGFTASYKSIPSKCGGNFKSNFGSIHSRNYPHNYMDEDDCFWSIEVDKNHVIKLTFVDFDVEAHNGCSADYVNVFDGSSENDTLLLNHCGRFLPSPLAVYSTGNKLLIRMKTDGTITAKGFLANYTIHCGAHLTGEDFGELSFAASSLAHAVPSNNNNNNNNNNNSCSWIIEGSSEDERVTLTISHMDISPNNMEAEECPVAFVEVRDGMDINAPLIGKYCGTRIPPHITSTGSVLFVRYVTEFIGSLGNFKAFYSTLKSACGGELTSEHGAFASPGMPGSYPANAECVWTIVTSLGNRAMLSFRSFNLEQSDDCDRDYVEIREGDSMGSLIGVYCGDSIPSNITASNKFWIKFRSDEEGTGLGFVADYSMLHGNEISGEQGQITSPLYPHAYLHNGNFQWRITVGFRQVILITFEDFYMDHFPDNCLSYISIHDGYDESAPTLFHDCSYNIPPPVTSSSNVVYIVWNVEGLRLGSWFSLNWIQVQQSRFPFLFNTTAATPSCGEFVYVDRNTTQFTSPGYPYGYTNNLNCEWIFETTPYNHLVFHVGNMNLQQSPYCIFDYLQIYNGFNNHQQWNLLKTYCFNNASDEEPIHGSSVMKVVFHTDHYRNGTGFSAFMDSVCGGSLSGSSGVIDALNDTENNAEQGMMLISCEWNITVRRGRKVRVEFDIFDVYYPDNSNCGHNYVLLKNGGSAFSPILGDGKYCGTAIPQIPETIGNQMYIKYKAYRGTKGFKLRFMEKSLSCGGHFRLSSGFDSQIFSSPNYPQIPPPHTECEWIFLAPGGERISLDFLERFDISLSLGCSEAFVEVRDGGTQNSALIGQFCRDMPGTLTSTGNILYVRFFTDVTDPRNGFRAKASVATCGGTLRGQSGVIVFPSYPFSYPSNSVCKWNIVGPLGHSVKLTFYDMGLPEDHNCSRTDHVSVTEKIIGIQSAVNAHTTLSPLSSFPSDGHWYDDEYEEISSNNQGGDLVETEKRRRILAILCGSTTPPPIEGSSNELEVTFRSLAEHSSAKGFSLRFESSRKPCGGELDGAPSGVIESPGYPNAMNHNRLCVWAITVPLGRRIRVEFIDLDLGGNRVHCSQRVSLHNGHRISSIIKYFCGQDSPEVVESTSNTMLVYFWLRHPSNHRGFKALYSSDLPTICEGDLNSASGVITSPREANITSYYCEWERKQVSPSNFTFAMTLLESQIGQAAISVCRFSPSSLYITAGDDLFLGEFCGNYTTPQFMVTPYQEIKIVAQQVYRKSIVGGINNFTLQYSVHECGGILTGPHVVITSPNFPQEYPANSECAWAINYPEGQQIRLKFLNLDLEVDCEHDFVLVRNGRTRRSPLIGKYCGSVIPSDILSQSNYLWIRFHSNLLKQASGFKLTTEPVIGGCGGIFHGNNGEILSPNYPQKYPNNAECIWEINAGNGYHIGLVFVERFQLEGGEDCLNDYIEVFNFLDNNWVSLGKTCGRNPPGSFNSTGKQMKVIFRSNAAVSGDGFKAQWKGNCGGVITAKSGHIMSPGYPGLYARDLRCEYSISAPGEYIKAEFQDFNLESGPSNCPFDNVTIYMADRRRSSRRHSKLGPYCGDDNPPFVRSADLLKIVFETDSWVQRRGFLLKYEVDTCGGYINEPSIIKSPSHPDSYYGQLNCTWVIEAPANQVVLLVFEFFNLEMSSTCSYDWVAIYDWPQIDVMKRLARFCGNMNKEPPVVKSTTRNMVVQFVTDTSVHFEGFKASVSFTYGEQSGCGGRKILSHGAAPVSLRSPDIIGSDNLYEPFLECQWLLIGPPQEVLHLEFRTMDIIPCNLTSNSSSTLSYCECDFIEIRDGAGPFSELIGKYCGSRIPSVIISSFNQIWLRFVSDSTGNSRGFQVDISSIQSPCGPNTVLNMSNVAQVLTSPNYPSNYPNNLRCRWLLTSTINSRFDIHFVDMDLEDSENCENDMLQIHDTVVSGIITEGFGNSLIYRGNTEIETSHPFRNGRVPMQISKFCGTTHPSDFYSGTSNVVIAFRTNSGNTSRGFKLEYQFEGCNRNFTGKQGRILNTRAAQGDNCHITIQAEANHTISLYFNEFFLANSDGCINSGLEVRDGLANDSPSIVKLCGYRLPEPIFSTSSALSMRMWFSRQWMNERYDITYTTTDKGRGCGGRLFNYGGRFTSPLYPSNMMNSSSSCRWEVAVPEGSRVTLYFEVFDLGLRRMCETNYLDIFDVDKSTKAEVFRAKYCGMDNPAIFTGASNVVIVQYVTSIDNMGRGWMIKFIATKSGLLN